MLPWMPPLAIGCVGEPHRWRGVFSGCPFIANIGPEAAGPGLSVAGCEHRNRRVGGMDLARRKDMLSQLPHPWCEQLAAPCFPTFPLYAVYIHALARRGL